MTSQQSAPAERDPSAIPVYLAAFHRYMADKGLRVETIPLRVLIEHHARCGHRVFDGWAESSDRLLWGVYAGRDLIATWAAKAYLMAPGETLRSMMETRGLYANDDERWILRGPAADMADTVTDLAVFEGGLCVPTEWRGSPESDTVIREMGLFARASAIDHWAAPWVFFTTKNGRALSRRFAPEHLLGEIEWTKAGEARDGITRELGLSSAEWIVRCAEAWPRRP